MVVVVHDGLLQVIDREKQIFAYTRHDKRILFHANDTKGLYTSIIEVRNLNSGRCFKSPRFFVNYQREIVEVAFDMLKKGILPKGKHRTNL